MAAEPDKKPSAEEEPDKKPSVADNKPDKKPSAADNELDKKPSAEEESSNECVVCLDAPKTHILVPCFHKCLCEECAEQIGVGGQCPVCRAVVTCISRVFE